MLSEASFVPLEAFRWIRISGADRIAYLQTKLTADTTGWRGAGGYTAAVDIDGRILFDAVAWDRSDGVWLLVEPDRAGDAAAHLERYVIMEDVTVTPLPDHRAVLMGSSAAAALVESAPEAGTFDSVDVEGGWLAASRSFGTPTWIWCGPEDQVAGCTARLERAGASEVPATALDAAQIVAGTPRLGRDLVVGRTIPNEAGLWEAVSLRKGCYLGQEVIERLFSRGNPARRLVRVTWTGPAVAAETPLLVGEAEAGHITASVAGDDGVVALAWLRRKFLKAAPGEVTVGAEGPALRTVRLAGTEPDA